MSAEDWLDPDDYEDYLSDDDRKDPRPRCRHLVVYPKDNCLECIKEANAALRSQLEEHVIIIDGLAALKADAEMYHWLRDGLSYQAINPDLRLVVILDESADAYEGVSGERLDKIIREAMREATMSEFSALFPTPRTGRNADDMGIPPEGAAMSEYKQYKRKEVAELVEWTAEFDMSGVSVSTPDTKAGSPKAGDMIARNPKNHEDRWLVAAKYFADNFEPVEQKEQR